MSPIKFTFALVALSIYCVGMGSSNDLLRQNVDPKVNPGDDFFAYANGTWLKKNPIPDSDSEWGVGNLVVEDVNRKLRAICESAAKKSPTTGSDDQKVGDFWKVGMDVKKADRLGISPLRPQLAKIDGVKSVRDAIALSFEFQEIGVDLLFGSYIGQDPKASDVMAVQLGQGGLGLPERDFYFNAEAGVTKIRAEYLNYVEQMLAKAGVADAKAAAARVLAFETELAQISHKLEDLRDPQKTYNKVSVSDLETKLAPSFNFVDRFAEWKIQPTYVIVEAPDYYTNLESLLGKTPVETLQDYARFHLLDRFAPYLGSDLELIHFNFANGVLSGQKKMKPRWKRVLANENRSLGFVLGRVFSKAYFPPTTKQRYSDEVEAIRTAFAARIEKLDWMSAATKLKAQQKLAAVRKKVGYPDKWKDYSALSIGTDSYCDNVMRVSRWNFQDSISKFGKPVDRDEWGMTPQTYNAYYNPSNNEIVLPAAMFTIPGRKDSEIDDAFAYGYAAASTVGHEITHGFDDEGRQFDPNGNLTNWWTAEDAKKFGERADVMVKQFDSYTPIPGIHINGKASLGENIADFGGVLLGLDAFKKTDQYKIGKKIGGFTPIQRFFLGYAYSWLLLEREQQLREQLLSDVHSPAKWRVNGPLSNIPEFYEAFGIKPGQPMWRPENQRVRIW